MMLKEPDFWMAPLKRFVIATPYGVKDTGLFKATFYGPRLTDSADNMPRWYQASRLVENNKQGVIAFNEWVDGTRKYIEEKGNDNESRIDCI